MSNSPILHFRHYFGKGRSPPEVSEATRLAAAIAERGEGSGDLGAFAADVIAS